MATNAQGKHFYNKHLQDFNLPLTNNQSQKKSLRFDDCSRPIIVGTEQNQAQPDNSSRSNSIKGRKLSFCDPQLTVSQNNTLESPEGLDYSYRDNQVQSSLNILSTNHANNQNKSHYASYVINPSHSESIIRAPSALVVSKQPHSQSRGLNPRQRKGASKKKKRQSQEGRPSTAGNKSMNKQLSSKQQHSNTRPSRSPLKEQKQSVYQNVNESRVMKSNNKPTKPQPASFLLTFSKDREDVSPNQGRKSIKKSQHKSSGKENKRMAVFYDYNDGIVNITNQEQRQKEEDRIRKHLHLSSSGKKKRNKSNENRFASPSANSNKQRKSIHQSNSFYKNRPSEGHSHMKSYIGSGEKGTPNRKSIDALIKDNIKKQKEQERKQLEKEEIKKEQESFRKKQLEINNKNIREANLKKQLLKLKMNMVKVAHTIDHKNQKSSPLRVQKPQSLKIKNNIRNRDMPLKVEAKRRKDQLGLEIFDLKKELGMKSIVTTIDQPSHRPKSRINDDQEMRVKQIQSNPKLQKLIHNQQKTRIKLQKKEKMQQLFQHFKVIENLKNLNRHCQEQRQGMKRHQKSAHFKTAYEDEQDTFMAQNRSKSKLRQHSPAKNAISARRPTLQAQSHREQPLVSKQFQPPSNKVVYSYVSHNAPESHNSKSVKRPGSSSAKAQSVANKKKLIELLIKQMEQQSESMHLVQKPRKKSSQKSSSRVKQGKKISPEKKPIETNNQSNISQNKSTTSRHNITESPTRSARREIHDKNDSQFDSSQQNNSQQSDNIQIDDEMMIFCVLTTAASIIQRNFRAYLQRKHDRQQTVLINPNFQDSALLENRLMPSDFKALEHHQAEKSQQMRKGGPKHTFSFGNYDYEHAIMPLQQQKQQISPIQQKPYQKEEQKQQQSYQKPLEEELDLERSLENALKINDKFKYALRSIAEKQKNNNLLSQFKKKKTDTKNSKEQTLNENRIQQMIPPKAQQQQELQLPEQESELHFENVLLSPVKSESPPPKQKSSKVMSPLERELEQLSKQKSLINVENNDYMGAEMSRLSIEIDQESSEPSNKGNKKEQLQINVNNNESLVSMSQGEQTDKIICYSPINTNEELLEQQINQSNTLNNDESMTSNNHNHQSRVEDDPFLKLPSEKGAYHSMLLEENMVYSKHKSRQVRSEESSSEDEGEGNEYQQSSQKKLSAQKKPYLRLMFGDEKFLLGHEEGLGSAPSSQRFHPQIENPYFLQTNASIFDRNPFKEFTTNKLHEILSNKNLNELQLLKEDAIKYQEKLEKGLINRMERRSELSPKTSQRKKYELESWVSAERRNILEEKDHPMNVCDLEQERQEAAKIIEQVNRKAQDIKERLVAQQPVKNLTPRQSSQLVKQQIQLTVNEIKEESNSRLEISEDLFESSKADQMESMEESKIQEVRKKDQMVLEISIEEEEDQGQALRLLMEQNLQIEKDLEQKKKRDLCEKLTKEILEGLVKEEIQGRLFPMRKVVAQEMKQIQVLEQQVIPIHPLPAPHSAYERPSQPSNNPQQKIEKSLVPRHLPLNQPEAIPSNPSQQQHLQHPQEHDFNATSRQSRPTVGIDTTDEAIETYIEEVFEQIRIRKPQFLQAFATPIYKNPMEVLNNLQKPEYGDLDMSMDMTSSLACILNIQLYLTLEKAQENLIQEAINQIKQQHLSLTPSLNHLTEEELVDVISESQHIHNKVIFDCVNEALNSVRPYGQAGEPMPWSNKSRKNMLLAYEKVDVLEQILGKVKSKVLGWQKTKAGALPLVNGQQLATLDEEHFAQQREKCLAQLLASDLIEGEEKWLDYEMEEAQVKIDLSDIVLEHLVGETCEILNKLQGINIQ